MDIIGVLVLLGFLAFFGGMLYFAISTVRREAEQKKQLAQSLGFSPIEADANLADKIAALYRRPGARTRYELRNVSRRVTPDGEMYLFDLVDKSGDDDSWTEKQAVAITSPYLKMPPFTLFPKADQKYAISGLANKVLEWGMSFVSSQVEFPEYPEFESLYIVTSNESSDWVRGFFDQRLADYFSRTQMFMLRAADDIFTFSEMGTKLDGGDPNILSQRVNRALEVFRALQK
jgi:hypothetical protein